MAEVTIILHQMFTVWPRCLLYFIHSMLSPCNKLAAILK